jgi:hypothetical protein
MMQRVAMKIVSRPKEHRDAQRTWRRPSGCRLGTHPIWCRWWNWWARRELQVTLSRAKTIYESVGQAPIVVRREIDGFILNRQQGALLSEAFRLAGEGYATRRISTRR